MIKGIVNDKISYDDNEFILDKSSASRIIVNIGNGKCSFLVGVVKDQGWQVIFLRI